MFDKFFDWMGFIIFKNVLLHYCLTKPFLKPYTYVDDKQFTLLIWTTLCYFSVWKASIESITDGSYSKTGKAILFLLCQTYEALTITTHSFVDLISL